MKRLASQIYAAVKHGVLEEPFNADAVRAACPDWGDHTYGVFLPKHRVGNPVGHTELFRRVEPGLYETL